MWIACSPGGRFLRLSLMVTPLVAGWMVALPTLSPLAFFKATLYCLPACRRAGVTATKRHKDANFRTALEEYIIRRLYRPGACPYGWDDNRKDSSICDRNPVP